MSVSIKWTASNLKQNHLLDDAQRSITETYRQIHTFECVY